MNFGSGLPTIACLTILTAAWALFIPAAFAQDDEKEKVEVETKYDKFEDRTSAELMPLTVWGAYYDRLLMGAIAMKPGNVQDRRQPDQAALFFISLTKERSPLGEASLIALVDGERLRLGTAKILLKKNPIGSVIKEEMLVRISWEDLRKIANAKSVEMKLGHTEFSLKTKHYEGLKGVVRSVFPFEVPSGTSSQSQTSLATTADNTKPALVDRAVKRVQPDYPLVAKQAKAQGVVKVRVIVSEDGKVEEADAIEGHPLLRSAATEAARMWEFAPFKVNGKLAKTEGILSFNFALQ